MDFALVDEAGGQHTAGRAAPTDGFAIGGVGLVDHAEGIALAQLTAEIDVGAEDFGDLVGDRVGDAGVVGGGEQRGVDRAGSHLLAHLQLNLLGAGAQALGGALHAQAGEVRIDLGRILGRAARHQFDQAAVLGHHLDHLAGAAAHQARSHGVGAQEAGGFGVIHAQALQQGVDGVRGAGDVAAVQRQHLAVQRVQLGGQLRQGQRLVDGGDGGLGLMEFQGGQRGHAEGGDGRSGQQGGDSGGDPARVAVRDRLKRSQWGQPTAQIHRSQSLSPRIARRPRGQRPGGTARYPSKVPKYSGVARHLLP